MSTITNASLAYTGLCIDIGSENSSGEVSTSSSRTVSNPLASLRSSSSMRGLVQAELGGCMIEKSIEPTGSGFKEGQKIQLDSMSPNLCTTARKPSNGTQDSLEHPEAQASLSRHGTLITAGANPTRNSAELRTILGNHSRLRPGATVLQPLDRSDLESETTYLEQAKPRARVEVDIALESPVCVQGGYLSGKLKIRVRQRTKKEAAIMVSGGKIRVIGFECIRNESDRHTFYLCSSSFSSVTDASHELFDSSADEEGFAYAKEGVHNFPFSMHLPLDSDVGNAKGVILGSHAGVAIRLDAFLSSLKVREAETGRRSIAHFYRDCEIWPRLNPSVVLAPASAPIQATTSKSLFRGGTGKVTLTAILHRFHWVAGQQCYVKVNIANLTKKVIKSLTLTLFRTTVVFKPRPHLNVETTLELDADACLTSTSQKQVAESTLEMGQCPGRGHASAKGWWAGVQGGQTMDFSHFILLPPDALSISRTRLLEVEYTLKVSVSAGALTSDADVALPIRIINFLSIDPPPTVPSASPFSTVRHRSASQTSTCSYVTGTQRSRQSGIVLESLEECEDEEDSSEDLAADDVDSTHSETPDDDEELALGSLAIHDDTDAVVHYAVTSAKIDTKYAQSATRFADLYYTSLRENADGGPEDCPDIPPDSSEGTVRSDSAVPRKRCHSSFAQRVQHKLQAAEEDGRLKSVGAADFLTPMDTESPLPTAQGSYFRPREDMPDEVEPNLRPPISRQSSDAESSASSASAGSRFSFVRTESDSSQSSSEVALEHNPRGSRVLSRHPCLAPQQPCGRPRAQTIAAFQPSAPITLGGRSNPLSSVGGVNPRPTLLSTSPSSCNSVKDRIRQLEERVQAERKLEMSGPL